jgi:tetratricopeptide (TPR) repeat protein
MAYSVHPLVQYWARHRMTKEEQADAFRTATALLATAAGSRSAEENYTFRRQLIPHVNALHQFRVETGLPDHYYDDASNYFWILYEENEYWKDAERVGQKVVKKRLGVLGETHPSTVESMARLALTLRQLGLWEGAEKLQQKALAYRRKFLGEGHTDTLESMTSLAMVYFDQARYEDAKKLQFQVFETQTNELGDDDRNTIKSATALGQIYLGLGKCGEAATLLGYA